MSPQRAVIAGISLAACAPFARGAEAATPVAGPGPGVVMGRILDPYYQTRCPLPVAANTVFAERVTRIRVTTDAHGVLTSAEVRWSSGYPQLDAAALGCIRKQRFSPTTRDGVPVAAVQFLAWWWKARPKPLRTCDVSPNVSDAASLPDGIVSNVRVLVRPTEHPASSVVCVCTDESGNRVGDPVLSASSQSERLDRATMTIARKLPPYPEGGAGCMRVLLNFASDLGWH